MARPPKVESKPRRVADTTFNVLPSDVRKRIEEVRKELELNPDLAYHLFQTCPQYFWVLETSVSGPISVNQLEKAYTAICRLQKDIFDWKRRIERRDRDRQAESRHAEYAIFAQQRNDLEARRLAVVTDPAYEYDTIVNAHFQRIIEAVIPTTAGYRILGHYGRAIKCAERKLSELEAQASDVVTDK